MIEFRENGIIKCMPADEYILYIKKKYGSILAHKIFIDKYSELTYNCSTNMAIYCNSMNIIELQNYYKSLIDENFRDRKHLLNIINEEN